MDELFVNKPDTERAEIGLENRRSSGQRAVGTEIRFMGITIQGLEPITLALPQPWLSGRMFDFYAVGRGSGSLSGHIKDLKMLHVDSLLSIQHIWKRVWELNTKC